MGEEGRARRREEGEDRIDLTSDSLGGNRKNKAKPVRSSTRPRCWGGEVGTGDSLKKKKGEKKNKTHKQTQTNLGGRELQKRPPPAGALRGAGRKSARPWPPPPAAPRARLGGRRASPRPLPESRAGE